MGVGASGPVVGLALTVSDAVDQVSLVVSLGVGYAALLNPGKVMPPGRAYMNGRFWHVTHL